MIQAKIALPLILIAVLLVGCASPAETSEPSTATEPSAQEESAPTSTNTSVPPTDAPTATTEPTATPEGQIFRDDFAGTLAPGWTIENENQNEWTINDDGQLQIIGDDPALLNGGYQTNLFWRDIPTGDFQITVHVSADTTSDFQQASIYIYQDEENYVTINRGFCSPCVDGGNGFFMDYKLAGSLGNYFVPADSSDVYLRLVSQNQQIVGFFAVEPDQWQQLGRVGNFLQAGQVGLGVSNSDGAQNYNDDLIGFFDFFEITIPE